jgi:hypothetical protein
MVSFSPGKGRILALAGNRVSVVQAHDGYIARLSVRVIRLLYLCLFNDAASGTGKNIEGPGIAIGYGLDDRVVRVRVPAGNFLMSTSSRLALGPTQPPIQWVPGGYFPRGKEAGA